MEYRVAFVCVSASLSVLALRFAYKRLIKVSISRRRRGRGNHRSGSEIVVCRGGAGGDEEELSSQKTPVVQLTEEEIWNTAIFFPDYRIIIYPDEEDGPTKQLIWYLEQATESLDLCVYGLFFPMLEECLMKKAKNVKIRLLTNNFPSPNRKLRKAGIQTRAKIHIWWNPKAPNMPLDLMHNKFLVIDNKAIMTGSLNWTWASVTENFENVMVSTNPQHVAKLSWEFQRLWDESDRSKFGPGCGKRKKRGNEILPC